MENDHNQDISYFKTDTINVCAMSKTLKSLKYKDSTKMNEILNSIYIKSSLKIHLKINPYNKVETGNNKKKLKLLKELSNIHCKRV